MKTTTTETQQVFRDPAFEAEYRDDHACLEVVRAGAGRADTEDVALASAMRRVIAPTATKRKKDHEIEVGDIIVFSGTPHRVDRIDPPTAETLAFFPTCIGYARSSDGWGISLCGKGCGPGMEVL
jgi:hypothetical protein